MIAAFVIWCVMGLFFIGMGIYDYHAKTTRPFSFWSNVKVTEIKNVQAYNKALGKLFIAFGIVFIIYALRRPAVADVRAVVNNANKMYNQEDKKKGKK